MLKTNSAQNLIALCKVFVHEASATIQTYASSLEQKRVALIQIPGVRSKPSAQTDGVCFATGGSVSRRVVLPHDPREGLPAPEENELVLFSPEDGTETIIRLGAEGITLTGTDIIINGNLTVAGNLAITGSVAIEGDTFTWNGSRVAVAGDRDTDGDTII